MASATTGRASRSPQRASERDRRVPAYPPTPPLVSESRYPPIFRCGRHFFHFRGSNLPFRTQVPEPGNINGLNGSPHPHPVENVPDSLDDLNG